MYTNDEVMLFVQRYAEQLQECFLFSRISKELAWKLYSKKEMFFLANQNNIPSPRSFFPESFNHLNKIAEQLKFPVMLKAVDGILMDKKDGRKMIARNREELFNYYKDFEDPGMPNITIQEYIPRDEKTYWIYDGYFNDKSECLVEFTGRKLRQYPPHFGMTTLGVCEQNNTLSELSREFLTAVGYKGIVGMDYCYDIRDKQYKVVDVNIRIAANFRLFVGTDGLDVVQSQYLDLTGQNVPATTFEDGRKWIAEDKDLLASYHYFREGKLSFISWLKSLIKINEFGYFDIRDQKPFWRMIRNHLIRIISKLRRKNEKLGEQHWDVKSVQNRAVHIIQLKR
jgi:predicted ATP-grasp superfamily ATP-dependent carboligase